MIERLFAWTQYFLPHHLVSRAVYSLVESTNWRVKSTLIEMAIKRFGVDLSEAEREFPQEYRNFNDFFTRALKAEARPLPEDPAQIVSPADGTISQIGKVEDGRIFQAKGHDYSLIELLGGDTEIAQQFMGGHFATIYLSPKDYHRVHMPLSGSLKKMIHIPGRLFSVNRNTTEQIPNLFARNERVVSIFETERGPMAVILVGAMIVASIETVWAGLVTPRQKAVTVTRYGEDARETVELERGAELGRFKMGSTAIILFGHEQVEWLEKQYAGSVVKMGEAMANPYSEAHSTEAEPKTEN